MPTLWDKTLKGRHLNADFRCRTGGHADRRLSFMLLIPGWWFGEADVPQRHQMSGVPAIVSHISSSDSLDRCNLSESLGETTLLPSTFILDNVFTKKDTPPPLASTPPSARNSHL